MGAGGVGVSELRERLFAASPEALAELGERHRDAIVAEFRDWLVVPEPLRRDRAATQAYADAIMRIAQQLADAGEPRPLGWLAGDGRNEPLARWQAQLANSQELTEAGRPDAAVGVLRALLDSLDNASGTLVEDLATRQFAYVARRPVQSRDDCRGGLAVGIVVVKQPGG